MNDSEDSDRNEKDDNKKDNEIDDVKDSEDSDGNEKDDNKKDNKIDDVKDSEADNKSTMNNETDDEDTTNLCKVVTDSMKQRKELESRAYKGQEKQAKQVNNRRFLRGGEVLGLWTCCTIKMPQQRSQHVPANLPVQICGTSTTENGNVRYKLYTKNGVLKGTYGREQLVPTPRVTGTLLQINYDNISTAPELSLTRAGEVHTKLTGRLSYCRCIKGACNSSKSCICKKEGRVCGKNCHKGEPNLKCKNCPLPTQI